MLTIGHGVVKDLITGTVRHEGLRVHGEVEMCDRTVMTLDPLHWLEVIGHVVGDDGAIMSANGHNLVIG